jgi:hypothetical protein
VAASGAWFSDGGNGVKLVIPLESRPMTSCLDLDRIDSNGFKLFFLSSAPFTVCLLACLAWRAFLGPAKHATGRV